MAKVQEGPTCSNNQGQWKGSLKERKGKMASPSRMEERIDGKNKGKKSWHLPKKQKRDKVARS